MASTIKLKKGFDINLAGKAAKTVAKSDQPETFAIKPTDFIGMTRPKVMVAEGDVVKAGTPILFDKKNEKVMYVSPVSGEVVNIKRGAKRKLLEIVILADKTVDHEEFKRYTVSELSGLSTEEVKTALLAGGLWPNFIQRPFGVVANPDEEPKGIFISTFDTHPLAPDYDFLLQGGEKYFEAGIEILSNLTKGSVYVNVDADSEVSKVFGNVKKAKVSKFSGPHPAGNVGVQIHHINPINKGEVAWTINPYAVVQIGKFFLEGIYDGSKLVAVTGSEVSTPQYYKTYLGANIGKFLNNNLNSKHVRVISGNVLTGTSIGTDGHVGYYDNQVTVIPEGDKPRFFLTDGWLAPTAKRLSFHRALGLLSFLNPKKEYSLDTSTNGEPRAFVMTGAFEQVVPMDILPTHLIKAIMADDFDEMEELGIYEVIEEDLALCEFIDVSKHDVQALLREGITALMTS